MKLIKFLIYSYSLIGTIYQMYNLSQLYFKYQYITFREDLREIQLNFEYSYNILDFRRDYVNKDYWDHFIIPIIDKISILKNITNTEDWTFFKNSQNFTIFSEIFKNLYIKIMINGALDIIRDEIWISRNFYEHKYSIFFNRKITTKLNIYKTSQFIWMIYGDGIRNKFKLYQNENKKKMELDFRTFMKDVFYGVSRIKIYQNRDTSKCRDYEKEGIFGKDYCQKSCEDTNLNK